MQRILSFEQTPPLEDPLRYFLTAPAFALAAALLLLWRGEAAFLSRWSPLTLALTHLLTLGFLTMTMTGALLQMLPVVAGAEVPRPRLTAAGVHILLSSGAALLVAAFLSSLPLLFPFAMALLAAAFTGFLLAAWLALKGNPTVDPSVAGIRLALLALAVTAALGLLLAAGFAWPLPLPLVALADLHALWGLGGWVGLLVAAIAYQVVPMFQLTPLYPARLTCRLAPAVIALAIASTVMPAAGALACAYLLFAGTTVVLLWQRKRPKADAPTLFWYASMTSLALAALAWLAAIAVPTWGEQASFPLAIGVLLLIGFGYSVVNGMLYKIVPFLIWYHLQANLAATPVKAPNVRQVIAEKSARRQFGMHLLALCLLLLATLWPQQLTRPAGAVFLASVLALWFNLLRAARMYRTVVRASRVDHF
jgi:hypothetical protein